MISELRRIITRHRRISVPIIFILMTLVSVIYLWHFYVVYYNTDYLPHLYQIRSLGYSLSHFKYPWVSWGSSIPYGAVLSFSSWLILIPIALLGLIIHNGVDLFYLTIFICYLAMYFACYYGYHYACDKSWIHSFVFALFYTNSSIVYNWLFTSTDLGVVLALVFAPLAFLGFINLMEHHHCMMFIIGSLLVLLSHIVIGIILLATLFILGLLNIKRFKLTGIIKSIISIFILSACAILYWIPNIIIMNKNKVIIPLSKHIGSGLINYFDSPSNFVYCLISLVGIASIIEIKSKHYSWFDVELWIISLLCILINIKFINTIAEK